MAKTYQRSDDKKRELQQSCRRVMPITCEKHSLYDVKLPFPFKLHEMLEEAATHGYEDIVSWQPHGKAFRVHDPKEFAVMIMPRFFKQSQYKSFQRQLHIYGFHRITGKDMRDVGAYYHDSFIRGQRQRSFQMVRQKIKGQGEHSLYPLEKRDRKKVAPDFYDKDHQSLTLDPIMRGRTTVHPIQTTTGAVTQSRIEGSQIMALLSADGGIGSAGMSRSASCPEEKRTASVGIDTTTGDKQFGIASCGDLRLIGNASFPSRRPDQVQAASNAKEWLATRGRPVNLMNSDCSAGVVLEKNVLLGLTSSSIPPPTALNLPIQALFGPLKHRGDLQGSLQEAATTASSMAAMAATKSTPDVGSFHEGDEMFFEGKRFFFVENYADTQVNSSSDASTTKNTSATVTHFSMLHGSADAVSSRLGSLPRRLSWIARQA